MITHQRAVELFEYDPASGRLFWRDTGRAAGSLYHGYLKIKIGKKRYYAHRLIWLIVTGSWPSHTIDHIDLDRSNNRFENLRDIPHAANMRNSKVRSHNRTGLKGVSQCGQKYRAQISIDGRTKKLGLFGSAQEAHAAYVAVAKSLFGEFARAA